VAKVLIIDDHDIVRFGLETLVLGCDDMQLAGSAPSLADGLALIEQHRPDVVVSDMAVGDSSGLDTVRAVVRAQQGRRTLVVSMQDELLYGEQVLAAGAQGYVMKDSAHAFVLPAIRALLAGDTWASPRLQAKLVNRLLRRNRTGAQMPDPEAALTMRELEVLQELKGGRTTKEIARALELSVRTVDLHRANIKRKLNLRTGAELIAFASNKL
jgi:DNA-binding NarL/FixJ family response regulator